MNIKFGDLALVKSIIYSSVDSKTLLFLSGGKTPQELYADFAKEKKLSVGAVALVDERFGFANHSGSNEKMMRKTGLPSYLEEMGIEFFPILRSHLEGVKLDLEGTAQAYDKTVLQLMRRFEKKVAIMGIGEDGHTASLPAGIQNSNFKNQNYVIGIENFPGEFRKRITLTFKALSEMNKLIVLVFGENKKNALKKMFEKGSIGEIPARFYSKPEIAAKTLLITDQKI